MLFAFTFGAFGDLITAADLVILVCRALSSSAGSSYEYQYLIQELEALERILRLAEAATRTGLLDDRLSHSLKGEITRCRNVVKGLHEKIRSYQSALGSGSKAGGLATWRKIGWGLFKAPYVEETRAKLNTHRLNLTMLMTACTQYVLASRTRWVVIYI